MDGQLFTKVFVSAIGFLCCVLFWIIGFLEGRKESPADLFSGVRLSPEQVENIRAYNLQWGGFGSAGRFPLAFPAFWPFRAVAFCMGR